MSQINYYYIFGTDAVLAYEDHDTETFIKLMKDDNTMGILFKYTNHSPNDLLNEFSGWGDYREISKADYEYLKRNIYE